MPSFIEFNDLDSTQVISTIRQRGLRFLMHTVFERIVPSWLFRFSIMNVVELDVERLSKIPPEPRWLAQQINQESDREPVRQLTQNRLKNVSEHFAFSLSNAAAPDELLGGVWSAVNNFPESDLGFQLNIQPNQTWIYCAFVRKEARGQRIYPQLLSLAAKTVEDSVTSPVQILVAYVPWNRPSAKVHKKWARCQIGSIRSFRFLNWAWIGWSGKIRGNKHLTHNANTDLIQLSFKTDEG